MMKLDEDFYRGFYKNAIMSIERNTMRQYEDQRDAISFR